MEQVFGPARWLKRNSVKREALPLAPANHAADLKVANDDDVLSRMPQNILGGKKDGLPSKLKQLRIETLEAPGDRGLLVFCAMLCVSVGNKRSSLRGDSMALL